MNVYARPILGVAMALAVAGCQTATEHMASVQSEPPGSRLTLGAVQREIRIGMPSASVAEMLGAPNMVTTDEQRREVWVYDKISTDHAYSQSVAGVSILLLGAAASAGASSVSQRTLTVIVKFDDNGSVRDFAYRSSSF